jgi:hypothetical protein
MERLCANPMAILMQYADGLRATVRACEPEGPWLHHRVRAHITANCIIIDHFSAFESGLVAPFLYAA